MNLPGRLRNPLKGLINFKNSDNECFLCCHIRHLNPFKIHLKRITKADENMVIHLNCEGIKIPVTKKDFSKIEKKNNICINVFFYENNLVYPVYLSNEKFENCINLLMITDEKKPHCVYIKE